MREISVKNTVRMWDTYLVRLSFCFCFVLTRGAPRHRLYVCTLGGRHERLFSISLVRVLGVSRPVERQAPRDGLPGPWGLSLMSHIHSHRRFPLIQKFRVSLCSCSHCPHKIGRITKLKCSSVKRSCSIRSGTTRRATSQESEKQASFHLYHKAFLLSAHPRFIRRARGSTTQTGASAVFCE